ncbi:MAG: nicotinate (nicotinamide) nucleotide adenylyltransferase [Dehalococcoidia bacterium]|nr:nicotinate (nicotinamide) nucleotide adenylyltransferase [Dehalococcoidia bacterium]
MPPLLVLGGTFDPPHFGHLFLAECARYQFGAERVLFMPAGDPWRKTGTSVVAGQPETPPAREVTAAAHRLAMVRRATAGNPGFVVDDREIRRAGPTYTVDTLHELHAEGHDDIVLILGSDAVADMPNWKEPRRIRELARIAIAPKDAMAEVQATIDGRELVISMPPVPISSTTIRRRVHNGEPVRYLVPSSVERYIRDHGLYKA